MKRVDGEYDVIVIGGGPAGMMAAGTAGKEGKKVLLLEKNKDLGEKLKITGGGRCNITNYELDNRKLLKHYGDAEPYLYSPFSQFSVKDTFTFFERRKLPLVVQARGRVFPKTERAYDVYLVLKKYLKDNNVTTLLNHPVIKLIKNEKGNISLIETKNGKRFKAKNVILATGGTSHPETGSTGDGFRWLEKLGHTVVRPSPDIVPLKSPEPWLKDVSGISLSFMRIHFYLNGEHQFSKLGKILFTHFGISSPLILNSAREVSKLLKQGIVEAKIDMFPDTDHQKLDKRLVKLIEQNKNKYIKNVLPELIPKKLAEVILTITKVDGNTKVHSLSSDARKQIVNTMKSLPLHIEGLMGMEKAVIADGGIPLDEVDTRTMRSKKIENLFLTGDILHITRPSGGYSLQLCWTTGFVAGKHTK